MRRRSLIALFLGFALLVQASPEARSFRQKLGLIRSGKAPRGSRVTIRQNELNAFVQDAIAGRVRQGVREPRLELLGGDRAMGSAYVDFPKLRQAMGQPMNWALVKLLAGERDVRVYAQIRSGGGRAQVDLDRVEISGLAISGRALDYLIRNFVWPYYPNAKVGKPFELDYRIDRLEVQPTQVNVVFGR